MQFTTSCMADDIIHAPTSQAIEKVEEATGIKLLRKYKLPAMQYKAVDGEQRYAPEHPAAWCQEAMKQQHT